MKITEDILKKIKNFYLSLPEEIIIGIIEESFNRQQLRTIGKSKTTEQKINNIINDEVLNKKFILQLCKYNNIENIDNNNIGQIIKEVNRDNFKNKFLLILSELYSNEQVKEYLKTTEFDYLLNEFIDGNISEELDANNINNKYLVHIENQAPYYNIVPLYEITDNELREVGYDEFPDYGNIPIHPYNNFSQMNYINKPLWICKFDDNQLLDNAEHGFKGVGGKYAKVKFNGDELIRNKSIYKIDDERIYEIVNINGDILTDEIIEIAQEPMTEEVCVIKSGFIYGPFNYIIDKNRNKFYISKKKNDYILKRYSMEINKEYIHIYENIQDKIKDYYSSITISLAYFGDEKNIKVEEVDTISNEKLVETIINNLKTRTSIKMSQDKIDDIKNLFSLVEDSLSYLRIEKLKQYFNTVSVTNNFIENDLSKILEGLLCNEDTKDTIANILIKNKEIGQKLENVKSVDDEVNNKKAQLENIKILIADECEKLESIRKEIDKAKNETITEELKNTQSELKNLKDELEAKKREIEQIDTTYNIYNDLDKVKSMYDEYKSKADKAKCDAQEAKAEYDMRIKDLNNQQNKLRNYEKTIEETINTKLNSNDIDKSIADNTFNEIVADEMIKFASNRRNNIENTEIENKIAKKEKVAKKLEIQTFEELSLVDYIYDNMCKYREYEINEVVNIMICISQGFLTVFAGEPGVGKTTTCNYIANTMGLINNSYYLRYNEISVEKGWTSKRDLIGYYNPLTKSFNKNNSKLFEAFNILKKESEAKIYDFPYFILLDEANLSSMEYYWADFMNACDLSNDKRSLNLGEDYIFEIPKTLRFLATINYDHTTETLSPRLIDRAWIILLENDMQKIKDLFLETSITTYNDVQEKENNKIILYDDLIRYFSVSKDSNLSTISVSILQNIYKEFNDFKFNISPRVNNMIKDYILVGRELFKETDIMTNKEMIALDYAVAQKLLPKISGDGIEFKERFLSNLKNIFDKNSMLKCKNIIEKIISKGDLNMQYYQFFI
ncbi:hypothetical protein ACQR2L_05015 [Clostridium butyricum]|uniref:hypothetical protein n=1 Tax=Clostridium butyricum TaxID=1492 RepID=UPI003D0A8973